jgi:hypothetical protein
MGIKSEGRREVASGPVLFLSQVIVPIHETVRRGNRGEEEGEERGDSIVTGVRVGRERERRGEERGIRDFFPFSQFQPVFIF